MKLRKKGEMKNYKEFDPNIKANEIINQLVKEGISFRDMERILDFAKSNMKLLIPSNENNPLAL